MNYYFGLDLSLSGSAVVIIDENGSVIDSGIWGIKLDRDASEKEKIERLLFIAHNIISMSKKIKGYKYFAIERPAYRKIGAQLDLGEIQGVIKTQIYLALKCIPDMIVATHARKYVLGKGRFSKGRSGKMDIIKAVNDLGFQTSDDNIADAYVIAQCLRLQKMEMKND